jgi:hypothetical protein
MLAARSFARQRRAQSGLIAPLRSLRADRAGKPPASSSLVDEKACRQLLLSTAARDPSRNIC